MQFWSIRIACRSNVRCLDAMRCLCFVVGLLVLSVDAASQGFVLPSWLPTQREQMVQVLGLDAQLLPDSIRNSQVSRPELVAAQSVFTTHQQPVLPSNGNNCASCHSTPGAGGTSNITVTRLQGAHGTRNSVVLHSTAEVTPALKNGIRAERATISLMGDSYIEAVDEGDIRKIMKRQRLASNGKIVGKIALAPALEAGASPAALGKFGWKAQHSSLLSACADSMLNELGVPNHIYAAGGPGLAVFETWGVMTLHKGKVVTSTDFSLCALQSFRRTGPAS